MLRVLSVSWTVAISPTQSHLIYNTPVLVHYNKIHVKYVPASSHLRLTSVTRDIQQLFLNWLPSDYTPIYNTV